MYMLMELKIRKPLKGQSKYYNVKSLRCTSFLYVSLIKSRNYKQRYTKCHLVQLKLYMNLSDIKHI